MSDSTYVVNARIEVTIRDGVPLDRALCEVRRQINEMGQDPWPAGQDDADWWVGHETEAVAVAYENVGDGLAAERGILAGMTATHEGSTIDARNNIPATQTTEEQ